MTLEWLCYKLATPSGIAVSQTQCLVDGYLWPRLPLEKQAVRYRLVIDILSYI